MYHLGIATSRNHLLHWVVTNIPASSEAINAGSTTIVPYLPPIPFYGTGYHRIAFILFRHKDKIEFSHYFKDFESNGNGFVYLTIIYLNFFFYFFKL